MYLDRKLQLELMQKMAFSYPRAYDFTEELKMLNDQEQAQVYANLFYLQSHELLEPKSVMLNMGFGSIQSHNFVLGYTRLTAKGLDFLADDGGLSAILGVVTIKFEADQLKLLLEAKIMASDLPLERKQSMIDVLRELPAESIKHLTTKIVDTGYDNLDSLMSLIQNSLF